MAGMNTVKYRAFLEAVHCGNLTRTAEKLNYSQPAVTHMIQSLEQEYGFPLFLRAPDKLVPTQEALRILPYIRDILYNEESLYELTNQIRGIACGQIQIGTYYSIVRTFLPSLMKRFCNRYPLINLSLVEGNTTELVYALKNRMVDFAFTAQYEFSEFKFIPLLKDPLYVVLPKDHPLCSKEFISPKDLFQYPVISTEEKSEEDLMQISRLDGISPDIRMRAKQESSILSLVSCGMGVAIIPGLYLLKPVKGISVRKLSSAWNYRTIGVSLVSIKELSPASKTFLDYLPENFEEFIHSLDL